MRQRSHWALLLILFGSATVVLAQEKIVDQRIDEILGDDGSVPTHTKYREFISKLKKAVANHDAQSVAAMVNYPIGVSIDGKAVTIRSTAAFVRNYDRIISPSIAREE
jgi:hypothetical protein